MGAEGVRTVYALSRPGLGGARKSVLACLAFHANHKSGWCELKYGTVAEELGVSVSSVDKALKWLEAEGYITRGSRRRRNDGTLGSYSFTVLPPGTIPAGPPGNSAENHPEIFRRKNQIQEPTASSLTNGRTAEGEEAGEPKEGTAA